MSMTKKFTKFVVERINIGTHPHNTGRFWMIYSANKKKGLDYYIIFSPKVNMSSVQIVYKYLWVWI